jgi:hypothetical protein
MGARVGVGEGGAEARDSSDVRKRAGGDAAMRRAASRGGQGGQGWRVWREGVSMMARGCAAQREGVRRAGNSVGLLRVFGASRETDLWVRCGCWGGWITQQ